jgi:hypothetical protein
LATPLERAEFLDRGILRVLTVPKNEEKQTLADLDLAKGSYQSAQVDEDPASPAFVSGMAQFGSFSNKMISQLPLSKRTKPSAKPSGQRHSLPLLPR